MRNLELVRYSFGSDSTLGLLFDISGGGREFLCYTLEDEARDVKVPGETCIPPGTYEITLRVVGGFHGRYGAAFPGIHEGMLWLRGVENFEYILIHCGNDDDDTAGCILVGDTSQQNVTEQGFIGHSRNAYRRIYPPIAQALKAEERVVITVKEL